MTATIWLYTDNLIWAGVIWNCFYWTDNPYVFVVLEETNPITCLPFQNQFAQGSMHLNPASLVRAVIVTMLTCY